MIFFFFFSEVAKHWNRCPEKLWNPHPWTSSKLEALSNMQLNLTSQLVLWPTGTLELVSWRLDQINSRNPIQSKLLCDLTANFRWNPSLTLGVFKFLEKDSSAKLFANYIFFWCCYEDLCLLVNRILCTPCTNTVSIQIFNGQQGPVSLDKVEFETVSISGTNFSMLS